MVASKEQVYEWLAAVTDPEVTVLSILDLGIVRDVEVKEDHVKVSITPTYSGCPAMDVIAIQIRMALLSQGFKKVDVALQLRPVWTTDWMTDEGKRKLKEYGIAPPVRKSKDVLAMFEEEEVACPRCHSSDTGMISNFGPTACKSLYRCNNCKEPFEHFKCH